MKVIKHFLWVSNIKESKWLQLNCVSIRIGLIVSPWLSMILLTHFFSFCTFFHRINNWLPSKGSKPPFARCLRSDIDRWVQARLVKVMTTIQMTKVRHLRRIFIMQGEPLFFYKKKNKFFTVVQFFSWLSLFPININPPKYKPRPNT